MITALELLKAVLSSGLSFGRLSAQMSRYPQVLVNIRVLSKPPFDSLRDVAAEIELVERELRGRGRVLVRYSGTENLARVMIEGDQETRVKELANRLAGVIKRAIGE